jgi:hypothetical protein
VAERNLDFAVVVAQQRLLTGKTNINLIAVNRTMESNLPLLEVLGHRVLHFVSRSLVPGAMASAPLSLPRSSLASVTRRAFA